MSQTLASILDHQSSLVQEAAEALPHQFSQCTYALGYIRQAIYLCLTCRPPRGICSACSIACHTDHEQLELFPKQEENTENAYGPNFIGVFCRCGRQYDARKERETMIQCLACEDWFHESCLNLRERPISPESTPEPSPREGEIPSGADDNASDTSSSGLPPPLIRAIDYDCLICSACVRKNQTLCRYAGTPGALMVVRDGPQAQWRTIGKVEAESLAVNVQGLEAESQFATGEKRARSLSPADEAFAPKRARVSSELSTPLPCLAPPLNSLARHILGSSYTEPTSSTSMFTANMGEGDIFLTEGWRKRWCKCPSCLPSLEKHPYLLEEEETYEPPEDPDSALSLEELGLRALQHLPRDRALDGIRAFNEMRDNLMQHLRPFAQEGKEVTEADIRAFFDAQA
ncbi:uncharacterized protein FIBRA_03840 [Fibroporia radiculosa]|uniref:Zinc finger PHD-type domain-containing protein n=1 Tax=Fibroporia radiculosa TaxID=599839 RepID=J4G6E9_9APHY|nr:uncharacterized protein FIBRA_03840 [Fibroporia radiculosa]CCM01773.1 predicted protein [Fibroporia radiculosa]